MDAKHRLAIMVGLGCLLGACHKGPDTCSQYIGAMAGPTPFEATAAERDALDAQRRAKLRAITPPDDTLNALYTRLLDIDKELTDMYRASTGKAFDQATNTPEHRGRTKQLADDERVTRNDITKYCSHPKP